ncbi:tyrosine-type recombinase/integrase [Streptacidiphilus albus]|uniref:tyrosine-type recombinase/integrase n=1 Tax=Streptacidiphilus albus TaxID=105425 RepID=UPI00054C74C7|nr:site-specific integrase [Streptacidiphilus albus]
MAKQRSNGEGTVYQRKDGRWEAAGYVLVADGTSRRTRVYGATRKEAMDKLIEKIADSNKGMPVAADATTTVADYLTGWMETVAAHKLRPTTYATYSHYLKSFIIPGIGGKRIAALTPKDVRIWLHRVRTACQCCTQGWDAARDPNAPRGRARPRCCAIGHCCEKRVAPATLQYLRGILSSALAHAVREDELPRNVATSVRLGDTRSKPFEPLTGSEARRLLNAGRGTQLGVLVELALRTGLRKGEALGLRWSDLDLEQRAMSIRQTLQRSPTGEFAFYLPKTESSKRRIALPGECITSLRAHHVRQQAEHAALGDERPRLDLVFTNTCGNPLDGPSISRAFHRLCDQAGIRRVRFHDLRHTCATLLLEQGVDLVTIKDLLGHSQIHITADVYAHVRPRLQRDAIEAMGNALNGNDENDDEDGDDDLPIPALV